MIKKITIIFCTIFIILPKAFSQTLNPAVDVIRCPSTSFPNGAGELTTILFPDSAKFFTLVTTTTCKVDFYDNNITNSPFNANCTIQFADQSAATHSIGVKKKGVDQSPIIFTKIKSIADRTIDNAPPFVNAPLCNTANLYVAFSAMKYRKTGSSNPSDDYGSALPFYEYELPQGWLMTSGYNGPSSTPGLIVGSNDVIIKPNLLSGGDIKVRTVNADCGDFFKKSQWKIIPTNRSALSLKSNNSKNITLNCGDNRPVSFTVENGAAATCATYDWDVVNRGWLNSSGNPITGIITTTSPTLTLIPVNILSNRPKNVVVTIKAGTEQLKDSVIVNFTNNPPSLSVTGDETICTSKLYILSASNSFPLLGSATWTTSPSGLATTSPDPSDSKKVTASRVGTSAGILSLTANYTYPACSTNINVTNSYITVGTPKPSSVSKVPTPEGEVYLTVTFFPGVTYNYYEGGVLIESGSSNHYLTYVPCNTGKIVQFESVNDCGVSAKGQTGVSRTCSGGGALAISPNPVSDNMNITLNETQTINNVSSNTGILKDIREVQVIDKQGTLVKRQQYAVSTRNVSLNISNLNPDIYTVRTFDGTQWYSQQIIKD